MEEVNALFVCLGRHCERQVGNSPHLGGDGFYGCPSGTSHQPLSRAAWTIEKRWGCGYDVAFSMSTVVFNTAASAPVLAPAYDKLDSSADVCGHRSRVSNKCEAIQDSRWLIRIKFGTCGSLFRLASGPLREDVNQRVAATKHEVRTTIDKLFVGFRAAAPRTPDQTSVGAGPRRSPRIIPALRRVPTTVNEQARLRIALSFVDCLQHSCLYEHSARLNRFLCSITDVCSLTLHLTATRDKSQYHG